MPKFYGERMDILIEDTMTLEDAMTVNNSSADSQKADFGSNEISNEYIDAIFDEIKDDDIASEK